MSQTTEIKLPKGYKLTTETCIVVYGDHDKGSPDGIMIREGLTRANESVRLLKECGYRKVYGYAAASMVGRSFYERR